MCSINKLCATSLFTFVLLGSGCGGGSPSSNTEPTAPLPSIGIAAPQVITGTEPTAQPPSSNIDAPQLITNEPGVWRLPGSVPDEQGGFADCGPVRTMLRAPNPTQAKHSLDESTSGMSTCVMPGSFQNSWEFPDLPNVDFVGRDKLIYLNTDIMGDLRINGTRIQVNLVGGHVVRGRVCIVAGSMHISYAGYTPAFCS